MFGTCKECGNDLDMYYTLWCPSCTKKDELVYSTESINLVKMLDWCERRKLGIKERVWKRLCDYDYIQNDIMIKLNINEEFENWIKESDDVELTEDLRFVLKNFQEYNIMVLDISW